MSKQENPLNGFVSVLADQSLVQVVGRLIKNGAEFDSVEGFCDCAIRVFLARHNHVGLGGNQSSEVAAEVQR